MLRKTTLFMLGLLLVTALVVNFTGMTQAQQQQGEDNFFFVNYIGQEVILDLDDVTYVVPGTNTSPEGGRLTLQLAPGEHKYAVSVPGIPRGSAGEFTITPGDYIAKAVRLEKTSPVVNENNVLLVAPQDKVFVFDFDPFAPPAEETAVVDTWQPSVPLPGMGSLVWINHGGVDELTVDLAGQLYKVAPKTNEIPGRLQIDVTPGKYSYTASVPYGSLNGEVTVTAGEVIGLNIIPGIREEPEYDVGDDFEIPPVELTLFQEDLTEQATPVDQTEMAPVEESAAAETVPETNPNLAGTDPETNPNQAETGSQTGVEGVVVKNYTGDTIVFTINGQAYTVVPNAERTITLPPGEYNYTASLPFVATTGTVKLAAGQQVELSVAINISHDALSVYQN